MRLHVGRLLELKHVFQICMSVRGTPVFLQHNDTYRFPRLKVESLIHGHLLAEK